MKKAVIAIIAVVVALGLCGGGMYYHHQKEIAKMQDNGVKAVAAIVDLGDYRDDEAAQIQEIMDKADKKIQGLEDQEAIDKVIADATDQISEFKTDAQLTAEEKKAAEEAAKKKAEEEAAAAAAAAAASHKSGGSSGGSSSGGCVGGGSSNFY